MNHEHPYVLVGWSGSDDELASGVVRELERLGVPCWVAPRNSRGGQEDGLGVVTTVLLVAGDGADAATLQQLATQAGVRDLPAILATCNESVSRLPPVQDTISAPSASEIIARVVATFAQRGLPPVAGPAEPFIGQPIVPKSPTTALVVVAGAGTDAAGHDGVLDLLAAEAIQRGVATIRVGFPRSGLWLDEQTLPDVEAALTSAVTLLEQASGWAAAAVGVDLGGLVVARAAMAGRLAGVALWDTDREESRELQPRYRDDQLRYRTASGVEVSGSPDFLRGLDDYAVELEHRRFPVPLFSLSSLGHPRAALSARAWTDLDAGSAEVHQVRASRTLAEATAGWSASRSVDLTLDWLLQLKRRPASDRRADGALVDPAARAGAHAGKEFISYRQTDGQPFAERIQRHLDAVGVRNFLDRHDLTTESIDGVIKRTFHEDCAGGVLVVTPDIKDSNYIPGVELPALLRRANTDPGFSFSLHNTIRANGGLDAEAPDRLLGTTPDDDAPGPLVGLRQFDLAVDDGPDGMAVFLRSSLDVRLKNLRHDTVYLDIQCYGLTNDLTRETEKAGATWREHLSRTRTDRADLRLRIDEQHPEPVRMAFPLISEALNSLEPARIVVSGGARPAFAMALGGVLVKTRIKCPVTIVDEWGEWGVPGMPDPRLHTLETHEDTGLDLVPQADAVAVYLDFAQQPNDQYVRYLKAVGLRVSKAVRICRAEGEDRYLLPGEGTRLVAHATAEIRRLASGASTLHLFAAPTFPLAVMMGRELNMFEVHLYGHNKAQTNVRDCALYRPSIVLARDNAQVQQVLSPGGSYGTA